MGRKWSFEGPIFIGLHYAEDEGRVKIVKGDGHSYSLANVFIDFGVPVVSREKGKKYRIIVEEIEGE